MTEKDITLVLEESLLAFDEEQGIGEDIHSVYTYEEVGMLTRNEGFVLRLENGDEFQVTILKTKSGERG